MFVQAVLLQVTLTINYFFPFVPSSNVVQIEIQILILQADATKPPSEAGYQWGIVDGCDFSSNNYIECDGSQIQSMTTLIQGSSFKPGHTYYLYIDGYSGSEVTFKLRAIQGIGNLVVDKVEYFNVDNVGYFAGDTVSVCHNGQFKIEVEGVNNAASYIWKVNDVKENSDSSLLYRFKNRNTVYKVEAQGYTDCASSPFGVLYFKVDTIPDQVFKDTTVCAGDLSAGITPYNWQGGLINKEGISRFKVVYPNGCYFWQQIRMLKQNEPITSKDTVLCNVQSFNFGGKTLTRDTLIQMMYQTTIGCDSFVNYRFYFMKFDGSISKLECHNGSSYILRINTQNFDAADFDSIRVIWFLNNLPYKETNSLELFPVNQKGIYSAIVTLYKNNHYCSFDITSTNIDQIPDPTFLLSAAEICETDSIILSLNNYNNAFVYNLYALNSNVKDLGSGKYKLEWNTPGDYVIKIETDLNSCKTDYSLPVTVKKELRTPKINCTNSTISSIEYEWNESDSDCLDGYEIWINGAFSKNLISGPDIINGLSNGEEVNITVKAISDCVCPGKIDSIKCKALPCPAVEAKITGMPREICQDRLPDSYQLNYESASQGTLKWSGDGVDPSGKVLKSMLKPGENNVFLEVKVGECTYFFDTTIMVFPPVSFDYTISEISCYDTNDGAVFIKPLVGKPDFLYTLNGKEYSTSTINGLSDGNHSLIIEDANGCSAQSAFNLKRPDKLIFSIIGDEIIKINQAYNYYIVTDHNDIDSIIWYKNDSIVCASSICDSVELTSMDDFELCVDLIYDNGCRVGECINIRLDRNFEVIVPNIFTPNFDGINDFFKIRSTNGLDVGVKTFQVFDRWGELLYKRDNIIFGNSEDYIGWDGKFKENLAPPGVYVYYIEVIKETGEILKFVGDVTLLR